MKSRENKFSLSSSEPTRFKGGTLHTATRQQFPALKGLSIQELRLDPGGIREPHVHPNAAQMDFVISGRGRVGIIGPSGERQLLDMNTGDVAFIPHGHVHWIENPWKEPMQFMLIVNHEDPETILLSDLIRSLPRDTVDRAYGGASGLQGLLPTK
ncbi:MAG TPA: cupin domain-containing protein [Longimicrobium sp.]|nr:cupin domain-containing protein [Longimicrobium sp.]